MKMKFKAKYFEITIKVLKSATLVITLIIIIIAIINSYIRSVDQNDKVTMLLDKLTIEIPEKTQHNHVAKENVISAASPSDKYKSLDSSINQKYEDKKRTSSKTLYYRKRRYLQFPEGSSLQLVFNILLPIIDYTNYAILGITCALAFELPSKPLSELEDELVKELHKYSHGISKNDSALDLKYINKDNYQTYIRDKFSNVIYTHPSEYQYTNSYDSPEVFSNGKNNFYKNYIPAANSASYHQGKPLYYKNNHYSSLYNSKNSKFDAGKLFESFWKPSYSKSPYIRRQDGIPNRKQHSVYHIMGKRSIQDIKPSTVEENNSWLTKLDKIHLQYHRSSRHELYSKLEIMLDRRGKNGTECILRALCETGNRRHETEPEGLLTEIFRGVFTLPKDLDINHKNYHPMHDARDDAHWNRHNCSEAYPLCENFIWDGNFRV